jgi:hypothetical protein
LDLIELIINVDSLCKMNPKYLRNGAYSLSKRSRKLRKRATTKQKQGKRIK